VKKLFLLIAMLVPVIAGLSVYSWWESQNQQTVESRIEDHRNYRLFVPAKLIKPFVLERAGSQLSNNDLIENGHW